MSKLYAHKLALLVIRLGVKMARRKRCSNERDGIFEEGSNQLITNAGKEKEFTVISKKNNLS